MEVILIKKVSNLGTLGDIVHVKVGYAKNYLIPYGQALAATAENRAEVEKQRIELEKITFKELNFAKQRQEKVDGVSVNIPVHLSSEDKIFGSVGTAEIASAVNEFCSEALLEEEKIQKHEVILSDGALRALGTYNIILSLHADVAANVEINIVAAED